MDKLREKHKAGQMRYQVDDTGAVSVTIDTWPGLRFSCLRPALRIDAGDAPFTAIHVSRDGDGGTVVTYQTALAVRLVLSLRIVNGALQLHGVLHNDDIADHELDDVILLGTALDSATRINAEAVHTATVDIPASAPGRIAFGKKASAQVRVLEQGNYWGHVRRLGESATPVASADSGEHDASQSRVNGTSDHLWVAFDKTAGQSLLAGFQTSERWLGQILVEADSDGTVHHWRLGFDGANLCLPAGSTTALEEALLMTGADPWRLLQDYGDLVAARHDTTILDKTPVTWCSWYPYRLSVSEDRILETARIAAQRLIPLGMTTLIADLGWQAGNLPSTFDENERFPHGLRWLADHLEELDLRLGTWSAPYSISEFDPIATEHPEYLVQDDDGLPAASGTWFWEPHGKVHILDLTHPGAQAWLTSRMESLAARGVRYVKPDFIGCVGNPVARNRHDRTVAGGCATQTGRLGAHIIQQALPEATVLNCGGPEMPGTGALPLLYTCNDTGNTGFIATDFRRRNTLALACHLWKNHRWGIIQPSCLCVGLPGTLEEARLRATIAFLAGGQIDISDTLQTLPEDRWEVLTRTLPPHGVSATPVDLFAPLRAVPFDYETSTRGQHEQVDALPDLPAGTVWHLPIDAGWDRWDLVGIFAFPDDVDSATPKITRYVIPLERFGIEVDTPLIGYEFWSGQYLGTVPDARHHRDGYTHPGDFQDLLCGDAPGQLDLAFYGPAVKLLCLRRSRPHPWVAGSGFHQSCGTDLVDVVWDEDRSILRGRLRRPAGESGTLTFTTAGRAVLDVRVAGQAAPVRTGAGGSVVLALTTNAERTSWELCFA